MNDNQNFDSLVKDKLQNREFSFDETKWEKAQAMIEADERKKKIYKGLKISLVATVIGIGGFYLMSYNNTKEQQKKLTINETVPVVEAQSKATDVVVKLQEEKKETKTNIVPVNSKLPVEKVKANNQGQKETILKNLPVSDAIVNVEAQKTEKENTKTEVLVKNNSSKSTDGIVIKNEVKKDTAKELEAKIIYAADNQANEEFSNPSLNTNIANDNSYKLDMPNVFSPNGNGSNDVFYIPNNNNIAKVTFEIFNRMGEKVFETRNPAEGWDGLYKGKRLNGGVFVYFINATLKDGKTVLKKGNVTLLDN